MSSLATQGLLGSALAHPATGYSFVYHIEFYMLFVTLIALGPLVTARSRAPRPSPASSTPFGLAEFPG